MSACPHGQTGRTCSAVLNQFMDAMTSLRRSSAWYISVCHRDVTFSAIDLQAQKAFTLITSHRPPFVRVMCILSHCLTRLVVRIHLHYRVKAKTKATSLGMIPLFEAECLH